MALACMETIMPPEWWRGNHKSRNGAERRDRIASKRAGEHNPADDTVRRVETGFQGKPEKGALLLANAPGIASRIAVAVTDSSPSCSAAMSPAKPCK